jgi:hypothetical protein
VEHALEGLVRPLWRSEGWLPQASGRSESTSLP